MECYEHDLADGSLFGLLVLALEVEDGIPVPLGHCSQGCDWGEPHTSGTALRKCVWMLVCAIACLLACCYIP